MKYILLMYAVESIAQNFTPEEYQAAAQAWGDFGKEAQAAGVLLSHGFPAGILAWQVFR